MLLGQDCLVNWSLKFLMEAGEGVKRGNSAAHPVCLAFAGAT